MLTCIICAWMKFVRTTSHWWTRVLGRSIAYTIRHVWSFWSRWNFSRSLKPTKFYFETVIYLNVIYLKIFFILSVEAYNKSLIQLVIYFKIFFNLWANETWWKLCYKFWKRWAQQWKDITFARKSWSSFKKKKEKFAYSFLLNWLAV